MCLVVFALGTSKDLPLVIAANRDEFFGRPTAPASWWQHAGVDIFGGRDIEKGGTWLGLTRAGRVALVTNVRDPSLEREGSSRGWLVRDALVGTAMPPSLATDAYPAFNLLAGTREELWYLREGVAAQSVPAGFHALSNARLDTPWPKVVAARAAMKAARLDDVGALFRILSDDAPAPDAALPKTGVPLEAERALSPPFVRLQAMGYGTRCSTVVLMYADGKISFEERTFDASGKLAGTARTEMG